MSVLHVKELLIELMTASGIITAVDHVSFTLEKGETVTIIGESGSGKSTTAMGVLGLLPKDLAVMSGTIEIEGTDVLAHPRKLAAMRGRRVALIPQDPMTALSPTHTIGHQLGGAVRRGGSDRLSKREVEEKSIRLLEHVRIPSPAEQLRKFPHQLSGGMLQRVLIASALAADPVLIIADEPTSALDVTVQAGILDLLLTLQAESELALLLITHDLGVARVMSDRIKVMKDGRFVDRGQADELVDNPAVEYTRQLLDAVPRLGSWNGGDR
ncbi:ABC transporter ATP-binding protein [Microbacterium sp. MPKO10]|uniref:ABC transporter ATP-binding protein n=1 Tax=Microbacterium sp. MPKO10 TaxID=2989818 RepID=UPI002236466F|nr:ABC transporter ATP-binding protein [Microbacterium sp. MPKO10]MCW4456933.1 ABC transporter ATP-binding protein [Microbacterium sp. MPKO10]